MSSRLPRGRLLAFALLAILGAVGPAVAQGPPNVVLIIGDDLGWTDLGFMESFRTLETNQGPMPIQDIVQTPNLDSIAAAGVVFRNGNSTASVCQESLQTLLSASGLHSIQWTAMRQELRTVPGIQPLRFRQEVQYIRTLPRELGRLGYRSWEGGKMWEGTFAMAGFTRLRPDRRLLLGRRFGRVDWDPALCGSTAQGGLSATAPFEIFSTGQGRRFFSVAPALPLALQRRRSIGTPTKRWGCRTTRWYARTPPGSTRSSASSRARGRGLRRHADHLRE